MKLRIASIYLVFLIAVLAASVAHATAPSDFFHGVREEGMGGAAIAVVNDETALLSNPAGLGKVRGPIVTVVDPELQADSNWATLGSTDTSVLSDPQKLLALLSQQSNWNKNLYAKLSFFPSYVTTNFGVGFYYNDEVNAIVDSTGANFKLDYTNDYAAVLGYNFRFFDGRVKLGFTGRAIDRTEIHSTFPTAVTNLTLGNATAEGQGLAGDAGLLLTAPWEYLPSLAVVVRDIGTTSFNLNHGSLNGGASLYPQSVATTADVGLSISPILSKGTRMQITAEYRDVLTASTETSQITRFHTGIEFNLSDLIFIRGGLNQGYWTAGFELDVGLIQIQLASYGEEIGTSTSSLEDRRYVAKVGLRF